eukprot:gene11309-4120_t
MTKKHQKKKVHIFDRSLVKRIEKPDKSKTINFKKVSKTPAKERFYKEVEVNEWNEWKKIFLVGTEWNIYDESYRFPWNFDHLYQKLKNKEFKGKYIYAFGSTEPQMITLSNGVQTSAPIPHIVLVVGDTPPLSTLGITSVQRQDEEILAMSDMKMGFFQLKSKKKELSDLNNFFYLDCYERRSNLVNLKEEDKFKYDYCLPYIYKKEQENDLQQNTEIMVQLVVNGRGLSLDFDFEFDDVDEFVEEYSKENELTKEEAVIVKNAIKDEIKSTKEKFKKEKEEKLKRFSVYTKQQKAEFEKLKFYKFYPQNKDINVGDFKSPYINRYYGKAHEMF